MSDKQQVIAVGVGIAVIGLVMFLTIGGGGTPSKTISGDGFTFETEGDSADAAAVIQQIPVAAGLQGAGAAKEGGHQVVAGTFAPAGIPPGQADNADTTAQLDRFVQAAAKRAGYSEAFGPRYRKIDGKVALDYEFTPPQGSQVAKGNAYYVVGDDGRLYSVICTDAGSAVCTKAVDTLKVS